MDSINQVMDITEQARIGLTSLLEAAVEAKVLEYYEIESIKIKEYDDHIKATMKYRCKPPGAARFVKCELQLINTYEAE